jgi:hypothetical protein
MYRATERLCDASSAHPFVDFRAITNASLVVHFEMNFLDQTERKFMTWVCVAVWVLHDSEREASVEG